MNTKFCLSAILLILSTLCFATGPSYISSEIRPIAINNKGEILCKTRFQENWMGSHAYPTVSYGIAIIKKNKLDEIFSKEFQFEQIYNESIGINITEMIRLYEDWFYKDQNIPYDILFSKEEDIKHNIKLEDYHIKDLSKYEVNNKFTVKEFSQLYHIDLTKKEQLALLGAKSKTKEVENNSFILQYNFGNVLILKNGNLSHCFDEDYDTPIYFNYPKSLENLNVDYVCSEVTGLVFIKKERK